MEEFKALLMEVLKDEARVTELLEVLKDQDYAKQLLSLETAEDVQKSLKEKGIDVSIEEIKQLYKKVQRAEDSELTDESLKDVSGGNTTGYTVEEPLLAIIVNSCGQ